MRNPENLDKYFKGKNKITIGIIIKNPNYLLTGFKIMLDNKGNFASKDLPETVEFLKRTKNLNLS
jgi:hypothetical protein